MAQIPIITEDNLDDVLADIANTYGQLPGGRELRWCGMTKSLYRNQRRLDAVGTITRSLGISAHDIHTRSDGVERFELAHASCARTGAVLTLNHSPWMRHWGTKDARGWDSRATQEVDAMDGSFLMVQNLLDKANRRAKADVRIDMAFLNSELARADLNKDGTPDPFGEGVQDDQASALRMKNDLAYEICKYHFPTATVVHSGQLTGSHHVPGERTDGVAHTQLYVANQAMGMRLQYQRLLDAADNSGELGYGPWHTIMPWIGVGGFNHHGWGVKAGWRDDIPFAPALTWVFANDAMSTHRLEKPQGRPDYSRVKIWGSWPQRDTLKYWTHFIALACGAHGLDRFEENWPEVPV
jgi:hypothetical protein